MKRSTRWTLMLGVAVLVSVFAFNLTSSAAEPQQAQRAAGAQERTGAPDNNRGPVPANKSRKRPQLIDNPGEAKETNPDLPASMNGVVNEEEYHRLREAHINLLHGIEPGQPYDPGIRVRAIQQMEKQQRALKATAARIAANPTAASDANRFVPLISSTSWTELGPQPIPNGQTSIISTPVNGRTPTIAVHPTNPDIIYAGPAQGGVYRTLNGGQTWTKIFDSALSLVVGALTLAPSNPEILYVGTGEAGLSADSFAGIGLYRIDNASTAATLNGPINPNFTFTPTGGGSATVTTFGGRSIAQILVHPTNPAIIFVGTASGVVGNPGTSAGGGFVPPLGLRGLYRSTNATAAAGSVTFEKLTVTAAGSFDTPGTGNRNVMDMIFDPGDTTSNTLVCWVLGTTAANDGGIYRTTNALAASPTFTQTLITNAANARGELAVNRVANVTTMYAATGEISAQTCTGAANTAASGALRRSIDGGVTWSTTINGAGGFCGGQCFYDIAIDVDPTDANTIYIGGSAQGTCTRVLAKSTNGTTFTRADTGLHADTHDITIFPGNPNIVLTGDDGGIFRSVNKATNWNSLNNTGYSAVQFQGLAIHRSDRWMSLGGTQDNGTQFMLPSSDDLRPINQFRRADFGDGGYSLIDQSTDDTAAVTMYHTYFNQRLGLIGFARVSNTRCATEGNWAFKGVGAGTFTNECGDVEGQNGIIANDNVLFYAPMTLGPGTPNTVYFGTDKLYRSINRGDTMTLASQLLAPLAPPNQTLGSPISTIGISPQNDNVRIVGLTNGQVFATTSGLAVLTNVTPPGSPGTTTANGTRLVGRVLIDPNDVDTAYVAYGGQNLTAGQTHLYKTANLSAATPTWAAVGAGIPDVPVNALQVDPADSTKVYAGTDVGVFVSTDSGLNFAPFGTGLPRVAVFQMEIQNANRFLRIATHGRGLWEISLLPANSISISGTVTGAPAGTGLRLSGTSGLVTTLTDSSGNYTFSGLPVGGNYTVTPRSNNVSFTPSFRTFNDLAVSQTNVNFAGAANVVTPPPANSQVLISEVRFRGPGGTEDEFIELYNNTDADITVRPDTSGSAGWGLVSSAGVTIYVVPNNTVLPARSHFLIGGSAYSLSNNTPADAFAPFGVPDNDGVTLFGSTVNLATPLDAVGFTGASAQFREGAGLAPIGTDNGEYSLVRNLASGRPRDTNDNAADFLFISTTGGNLGGTVASVLGAPGPQGLRSPRQRNGQISTSFIEPGASSTAAPNRERDNSAGAGGVNRQLGTLTIRRRYTNNTGGTITKLRFRAVDFTTLNSPNVSGGVGQADLRLLDATGSAIITTLSTGGQPLCIRGARLEMPPVLDLGGGYNATATIDLTSSVTGTTNCPVSQTGIPAGQSVDVEFLLGVQQAGRFRFLVNIEALP